jgi:tetratricopeptide (TPR) repeat protein
MKRLALVAVAVCGSLWAQNQNRDLCAPAPGTVAPSLPAKLLSGQGEIDFPITTSSREAQAFFNQGVAQMHSFWAIEAERSFLQAAALDPAAPMPQWGIAMVAAGDFRPRFQLVRDTVRRRDGTTNNSRVPSGGVKRAQEAAKRAQELAEVPGKATPLEKLYIASIAARRQAAAKDADDAYIAGLRAIMAAQPDQVEAKTYLALHLMAGFTTPAREPRPGTMEAVALLRDLMVKAPDHMGVHHYVIHGWEGSSFAKEAWESCRRYPALVPNIPHALHMPGHIWAQTGKWDEAEKSFEEARDNELSYLRADQLYPNGHHGHNVHFLISSAGFNEKYEKAMENARALMEFKETPREAAMPDGPYIAYRQAWFSLMRTLVQFEKWDEILDGRTLPVHDKPRERAWRHWAMGLAHVAKGDAKQAANQAAAMDKALKDFEEKTGEDVAPPLAVAREELSGQVAAAKRNVNKAIEILLSAAKKERALRYTEPPSYPRPVLEVLGKLALAHGRTQVAEAAFREALDQYPESPRALRGLDEAMQRPGRTTSARR